MKKIKVLILFLSVFLLSGCQLAQPEDSEENEKIQEVETKYLPTNITFEVYGDNNEKIENIADYFDVNFICEGMSIFDDCAAFNYGKSMESVTQNIGTFRHELDGVYQPVENTRELEVNLYFKKTDQLLALYNSIHYISESGEEKIEEPFGVNLSDGVSQSFTMEGEYPNGDTLAIKYKMNLIEIDDLQLLTIREFDDTETMIKETTITRNQIMEILQLQENTDYLFILEEFKDGNENTYTNRTFYEASGFINYLYKYTNELGFLEGDHLQIRTDK
jgi:hypothetical protein